jgi:hypothetical protein
VIDSGWHALNTQGKYNANPDTCPMNRCTPPRSGRLGHNSPVLSRAHAVV